MNQKLVTIQYFRAIAALIVLFYHSSNSVTCFNFYKTDFVNLGHYGVQIFFFVSGLIMCKVIDKENTPELFLKKRIARIYPTYLQIYFLMIVVWVILRVVLDLQALPRKGFFLNMSLLPFEYDGGNSDRMVLQVGWTLYYEMIFYIILSISLFLFKKPIFGVYLLLFVGIFYKIQFLNFDTLMLFVFFAGYLLFEFIKTKNKLNLGLLLICFIKVGQADAAQAVILALISIFIFVGLHLEKINKMLKIKLLESLGDASYSIYLIHLPILFITNYFNWPLFLAVPLIIGLAILNYEYFEKKVAVKLKKFF